MSERRICKYCGMELSEDVPHGLRQCHLHAVTRITELEAVINQLIEAGEQVVANPYQYAWIKAWYDLVNDWKEG